MDRRSLLKKLGSLPLLGFLKPELLASDIECPPESQEKHLNKLLNNARHVNNWDFALASGQTINEKVDSLFIALNCLSVICSNEDSGDANCIVVGRTTGALLESSSAFKLANAEERDARDSRMIQSNFNLWLRGTLNNRWRLYFTSEHDQKDILVINDKELQKYIPNPDSYGKIIVGNFI